MSVTAAPFTFRAKASKAEQGLQIMELVRPKVYQCEIFWVCPSCAKQVASTRKVIALMAKE